MTSAINSEEGLSPQPRVFPNLICDWKQGDGLRVVHATPGRVRFRTTVSSLKSILDSTISQQLRQQDGVDEVCTNQQTGSLVVTFDQNKLSLPQIVGLLQQFGVSEPQASLSEAEEKKTDLFAAWKSVDFWKEQGLDFIPLITGLVVTGKLGIHGLLAIPVYMITAGATRQVIDITRGLSVSEPLASQESYSRRSSGQEASEFTYSVVHAIPGRARFNVPRLAHDRAYAQRLQRLLKTDAQVITVRVNPVAASIAIAYEPDVVPVSHWVDLMQLADDEANAPTNPTTATTQQSSQQQVSKPTVLIDLTTPTPEAASPWAELKPPALAASIAHMAKLPV